MASKGFFRSLTDRVQSASPQAGAELPGNVIRPGDTKARLGILEDFEKAGFGSRAAAPVVKCIFTALAGKIRVGKALPSDPLDVNSFEVAPPQYLPNPLCLVGTGSSVRD